MNEYLFFYLLGCGLVLGLSMFNLAFFWLLAWITKGNVLAKNLKKLQPPDDESRGIKIFALAAGMLLEMALSWIGVLAALWMMLSRVFKILREALTSTPEAVKLLRFPLRNNPNMSREAVWAYVHALSVRAGAKQRCAGDLLDLLDSIAEDHPTFDRADALRQLESLNVVSSKEVSAAVQQLSLKSGVTAPE